jgi:hypothetical protein
MRERGLRQVEPIGGAGDVAELGDGVDELEMADFEGD